MESSFGCGIPEFGSATFSSCSSNCNSTRLSNGVGKGRGLCRGFSFAPPGLLISHSPPTACAVGCILSPLRGFRSQPIYGLSDSWHRGKPEDGRKI